MLAHRKQMRFDMDPFPNYCKKRCNRLHMGYAASLQVWSKADPRTLAQVLFGILA
jgi:hypothetical protein